VGNIQGRTATYRKTPPEQSAAKEVDRCVAGEGGALKEKETPAFFRATSGQGESYPDCLDHLGKTVEEREVPSTGKKIRPHRRKGERKRDLRILRRRERKKDHLLRNHHGNGTDFLKKRERGHLSTKETRWEGASNIFPREGMIRRR